MCVLDLEMQSIVLISLLWIGHCGASSTLITWLWGKFREKTNREYGKCGDCFCIPDDPETGDCPFHLEPRTDFADLIPIFKQFRHLNPHQLDCDPFTVEGCETSPEPLETTGVACVAEFFTGGSSDLKCPDEWMYVLRTWGTNGNETLEDIIDVVQRDHPNAFVTHGGPCGTCSTLHDWSIYMEQAADLQDTATVCTILGAASRNPERGIRCFESLGFTRACAATWFYNSRWTRKQCQKFCLLSALKDTPSNGPSPSCQLNACLECDEVQSGHVFQATAGRTRRNSGLKSNIVRHCSEMNLPIVPQNPCDRSIIPETLT